jgi:hypothetical protein
MSKTCGFYFLRSGNRYLIGCTDDLESSEHHHLRRLDLGVHPCAALQAAHSVERTVFNPKGWGREALIERAEAFILDCRRAPAFDVIVLNNSPLTMDSFARVMSHEARAMMSEAKKGVKHPRSRPVSVTKDGVTQTYVSASEAAEALGVSRQMVSKALKLWVTCGGASVSLG